MRTLTYAEARQAYDRIGAFQDRQAFYEDKATNELIPHLDLAAAQSVFEFGCGTGRFAARLLAEHLPATATYRGIDLSPTMVGLASRRLAPFAPRATVELSEGGAPTAEPTGSYDRFLSNFVFDLLSLDDSRAVIAEAHRMLRAGGLLGLCSAAPGKTPATRLVTWVWSRIHSWKPALVGGCRPIELLPLLAASDWRIRHYARVAPFGIASEAVVAERLPRFRVLSEAELAMSSR